MSSPGYSSTSDLRRMYRQKKKTPTVGTMVRIVLNFEIPLFSLLFFYPPSSFPLHFLFLLPSSLFSYVVSSILLEKSKVDVFLMQGLLNCVLKSGLPFSFFLKIHDIKEEEGGVLLTITMKYLDTWKFTNLEFTTVRESTSRVVGVSLDTHTLCFMSIIRRLSLRYGLRVWLSWESLVDEHLIWS